MQELPIHRIEEKAPKRWVYYQGLPLCFYTLQIKAGETHRVYTPSRLDPRLSERADGLNSMSTITIVPPPGHVRIHSSALDQPSEWLGSWEVVAGGIIFEAEFDYEGLTNSEWLCVAGPGDRAFREAHDLWHRHLSPGDTFTFTENTWAIVSMFGDHTGKAFSGAAGETFTATTETHIAILEHRNV
jgi:hypothetical protein